MAKSAAERKANERKRKAEHLKAVGAKPFNMTMYSGTRECLDRLKEDHGFEEDGEIITRLIHNVSYRDKSQQAELLAVPTA